MVASVECLLAARVPKAGSTPDECEDQLAVREGGQLVAIADGASEATFAKLWARCLVERFVAEPTLAIDDAWLIPARQAFTAAIDYTNLPWHALEKLGRGSFATLAGLVFDLDRAVFSAVAVGDSCLAWHSEHSVGGFPYAEREAIPLRPYLLSTLAERNEELSEHLTALQDVPLASGNTHFFCMTDALAEWYLAEAESGGEPWAELLQLDSDEALARWIEEARTSGRLRNDDVALVALHVHLGYAEEPNEVPSA